MNAQLGALICELIKARDSSRHKLADATGFTRRPIADAAAGRGASPGVAKALDVALGAAGRIVELAELGREQKQQKRYQARQDRRMRYQENAALGSASPVIWRKVETSTEVSATDRRQFAISGLAAVGLVAADISHATAATTADTLTVRELKADVVDLARKYTTTAHDVLEPLVIDRWEQVVRDLPRTLGTTHDQLELLMGQYSYFLGRLAFNQGDLRTATRFADVASQYAAASRERARTTPDVLSAAVVLVGSAAALMSSIDYYGGEYETAAATAAWARENADHPYLAGRLAAYHARCLARIGDRDGAIAAIDVIEHGTGDLEPCPGESPLFPDVAAWQIARLWIDLGEGDRAERTARQAVAEGDGRHFENAGLAHLSLSAALLNRRTPEVDEAAACVGRVVNLLDGQPTWTVGKELGDCAARLMSRYPAVPAVRDLRAQLDARPRIGPPAAADA